MKYYLQTSYQQAVELDTDFIPESAILYLATRAKAFKQDGWSNTRETKWKECELDFNIVKIHPDQFIEPTDIDINAILEENNRLQREIDLLKANVSESKEVAI
jgi:hypothetical protein